MNYRHEGMVDFVVLLGTVYTIEDIKSVFFRDLG